MAGFNSRLDTTEQKSSELTHKLERPRINEEGKR